MSKILIVDDVNFLRRTLRDILEDAGHEVIGEAENGKHAIELFNEKRPELVTMDITMPLMNGIDAIKEIINTDPNAKIIVCSALGQTRIVVEAIEAGAKDFIVKPFNRTKVLDTVNRVV